MYSDVYNKDKQIAKKILESDLDVSEIDLIINKIDNGGKLKLYDAGKLLRVKNENQYQKIIKLAFDCTTKNHKCEVGLIAPLYFSNHCNNVCSCCDMSAANKNLCRRTISFEEYKRELKILQNIGYKTVELVGGGFPYRSSHGKNFKKFMSYGKKNIKNWAFFVDTFDESDYPEFVDPAISMIHWQESYDKQSYFEMVKSGPKCDFKKRLNAHDYWIKAGGKKVGLSILAGLSPSFLEDVFMTLSHGKYLENTYDISPSIFGTVRIQDTQDNKMKNAVFIDNKKMYLATAIYRLMFPLSNIIATSRENQDVIKNQILAGATFTNTTCTTVPGGYTKLLKNLADGQGQFSHNNPSFDEINQTIKATGRKINWQKTL